MNSAICEPAFQDFAQARLTAERQVAALRHDMAWTIWGSPPRYGLALCRHCGRQLRIERTRAGAFRLHWNTPGACPRLVVVALEAECVARKIA